MDSSVCSIDAIEAISSSSRRRARKSRCQTRRASRASVASVKQRVKRATQKQPAGTAVASKWSIRLRSRGCDPRRSEAYWPVLYYRGACVYAILSRVCTRLNIYGPLPNGAQSPENKCKCSTAMPSLSREGGPFMVDRYE